MPLGIETKSIEERMHEVVICPECLQEEYYGMLYWLNGRRMCRECMYDEWEEHSDWRRSATYQTFPIYDDGNDYRPSLKEDKQ